MQNFYVSMVLKIPTTLYTRQQTVYISFRSGGIPSVTKRLKSAHVFHTHEEAKKLADALTSAANQWFCLGQERVLWEVTTY
jgi:hypothetical protein